MRKILVTGSAGFIGYHVCLQLLKNGYDVIGIDSISDYYDVNLKLSRLERLKKYSKFQFSRIEIERTEDVLKMFGDTKIDCIIHLAAQAGVRYSIDRPDLYLKTNLIGTFTILELARKLKVDHLLAASTSSVYGDNTQMPFDETMKCDTPLSFYAATKKSNEVMGHSYSHLYSIPTTFFRFFTVYGPWGRPDMALFKFTKNILENKPIDIYNNGNMSRDFTYVADIANAICLLMEKPPNIKSETKKLNNQFDNLFKSAPYRAINIGNGAPVKLMKYIEALELALQKSALKNFMPMQAGDVPATWANTKQLESITGFKPSTDITSGIANFVDWYKRYYEVN